MHKRLLRVAVAAVVVLGFAAGMAPPVGATSERIRAYLHNECHKEWEALAHGGISAGANGNGYAQVSWAGGTSVGERRPYPSTDRFPDRSCLYQDFVQLDYRVSQGDNSCVYGACAWGMMADDSVGTRGMHEYPPEGVGYEWDGTHYWGVGPEQSWCGGYYFFWKSHGHAHVPHYTPHRPHGGIVDDGGAIGDPLAENSPLIAELESVEVPVDAGAIGVVNLGELVGPSISAPPIEPVYVSGTTPVI